LTAGFGAFSAFSAILEIRVAGSKNGTRTGLTRAVVI
jgi:hypothetical protein